MMKFSRVVLPKQGSICGGSLYLGPISDIGLTKNSLPAWTFAAEQSCLNKRAGIVSIVASNDSRMCLIWTVTIRVRLQAWTYAIEQSCLNKAAVVAADEREGGVRATLNLGHTFGHAIETGQGYGKCGFVDGHRNHLLHCDRMEAGGSPQKEQ